MPALRRRSLKGPAPRLHSGGTHCRARPHACTQEVLTEGPGPAPVLRRRSLKAWLPLWPALPRTGGLWFYGPLQWDEAGWLQDLAPAPPCPSLQLGPVCARQPRPQVKVPAPAPWQPGSLGWGGGGGWGTGMDLGTEGTCPAPSPRWPPIQSWHPRLVTRGCPGTLARHGTGEELGDLSHHS